MTEAELVAAIRQVIREETPRIAEAVVRKLRDAESRRDDAEFLASLPLEEMKRRAKEEMKREDRAKKESAETATSKKKAPKK